MDLEYLKLESQCDGLDAIFGRGNEVKHEVLPEEPTPYPDCSKNTNAKFGYYWTRPVQCPKGVTSLVWKYFTRCATLEADGTPYCDGRGIAVHVVKCHFCSKDLSYHSSSTKGMMFHLKRYHGIQTDSDARKELDDARKDGLKRPTEEIGVKDKRKKANLLADGNLQSNFEWLVMKNVVVEALPFSFVEDESTRAVWRSLNSKVGKISRKRLAKLVAVAYGDFENARVQFFEAADYFSVAVDEWNEPSTSKPLLAIRAHGWTKEFQRFDVTLDIVDFFDKEYDSDNAAEAIQKAILKNNLILSNVLCIVGDGNPVTADAAKKLKIKWIQCVAHKIHLVMEQLLESKEEAGSTKHLVDLLSHFADITKIVSTEGECVSAFAAAIVLLERSLERMRSDEDTSPVLGHLIGTALSLLRKGFFTQDGLLLDEDVKIALFLDPRFVNRLHIMSEVDWNLVKAQVESKAAVFDITKELEWSTCADSTSNTNAEYDGKLPTCSNEFIGARRRQTDVQFGGCSAVQALSETLHYIQQLATFQGNSVQDVASFWNGNIEEMPLLNQLARSYLSLPINALGLERIFSAAPNFIECKRRNSLGNFRPSQLIMLREYFLKDGKYFPLSTH